MTRISLENRAAFITFAAGMKKIFSTITVFLYFAMSCGIIVNLHYCMGSFQSYDLYTSVKKSCDRCGMPLDKKHGCCKDEIKIIKLQNDQRTTQLSYDFRKIETPVIVPTGFIAASINKIDGLSDSYQYPPPLLTDGDIYLQHCVFRI